MKKRVKLLTTIASLCLAVALMAFGVYAASTSKLTTSSTVTFTTTNVDVTYKVTVTHTADHVTVTGADEGKYTAPKYENTATQDILDTASDLTWNLGAYVFDEADAVVGDTIVYVVEITNNGSNAFNVTANNLPTEVATGAITIDVESDFTEDTALSVAGKTTVTLTVTYTLADNTLSMETPHTFNPDFSINGNLG